MRCAPLLSMLALASILAAAPAGSGVPEAPLRPGVQVTQELRTLVEHTAGLEEARAAAERLPRVLGATFEDRSSGGEARWSIRFQRTIPARDFVQGMRWSRPYAFSSDVHQATWTIDLWRADFMDFHRRPRIHSATPRVGRWAVRARLIGRPRGELPNVSKGSSPAYDLLAYDAEVGGIEMFPWKPEHDDLWLLEEARKARRQAPVMDVVARPAVYQGPCPVEVTFTGTLHGFRSDRAQIRWERSDGAWTEIETVEIRSPRQTVQTRWRVGARGRRLVVWQKLRLGPFDLMSEPARATIHCQ